MYTLRNFRVGHRLLVRRNASLQASASVPVDLSPPPPATPAQSEPVTTSASEGTTSTADAPTHPRTKGRRHRPTVRPNISLNNPRKWNRALGPGVLLAYDEALRVIKRDSDRLKAEVEEVEVALKEAKDEDADALKERLRILQVQSEINRPDVRWKAANGMADMSKPVYRHLIEQKWRKEGGLDLLMERIHQMKVVPDILPSLHPSVDLRVTFPAAPSQSEYLRGHVKPRHQEVEPAVFLIPEQTHKPPKVYVNAFHTDTRLYMLLMVDPDVPDQATQGFQTYLHWLQPNVSLSALTTGKLPLDTHTKYVSPHPQKGTAYHRYVVLLLPQPSPTEQLSIPVVTEDARLGFDVRAFLEEHKLGGDVGGGAHMWREVWSEEVSKIYAEVLKIPEPRYGRPPKADPYREVKTIKRYV